MAHRFDRRKPTEEEMERREKADRALHWQIQLNKELVNNGLRPCNNMVNAVNKAYDNDLIGTATYDRAHELRGVGNVAKHDFK